MVDHDRITIMDNRSCALEIHPREDVHLEELPREHVPLEAGPCRDVPYEEVLLREDIHCKDVLYEDVPPEELPRDDVPLEAGICGDVPRNALPYENAPGVGCTLRGYASQETTSRVRPPEHVKSLREYDLQGTTSKQRTF